VLYHRRGTAEVRAQTFMALQAWIATTCGQIFLKGGQGGNETRDHRTETQHIERCSLSASSKGFNFLCRNVLSRSRGGSLLEPRHGSWPHSVLWWYTVPGFPTHWVREEVQRVDALQAALSPTIANTCNEWQAIVSLAVAMDRRSDAKYGDRAAGGSILAHFLFRGHPFGAASTYPLCQWYGQGVLG
jgi:hypothetical protein